MGRIGALGLHARRGRQHGRAQQVGRKCHYPWRGNRTMSKPKRPFAGNKLRVRPKVKLLDPDKPLATYRVPAPPEGKFQDIPGQLAMDFSRDEWDALTEESA